MKRSHVKAEDILAVLRSQGSDGAKVLALYEAILGECSARGISADLGRSIRTIERNLTAARQLRRNAYSSTQDRVASDTQICVPTTQDRVSDLPRARARIESSLREDTYLARRLESVDRESKTTTDGASCTTEVVDSYFDRNQLSAPVKKQLAKLNGSAVFILENLRAGSESSAPENQKIAHGLATQVEAFGPDVVKEAFASMSAAIADGTAVGKPLRYLSSVCKAMSRERGEAAADFGEKPKPYPGYIGRGG